MKAKPYLNLCRNRIILEQMSRPEGSTRTYQGTANQSINMIAAQFGEAESNKKQAEIFKKHVDAAFESGIEKHGPGDRDWETSAQV